jgi:purine-nucleoside phosphorylase
VTATAGAVDAPVGAARGDVAAAVAAVRARHADRPLAAVVLGTGLGGLAEHMDVTARVPYAEIPGMPRATVESHAGRLLCGTLAGVPVVAMQGRFHRYEGHAMPDVAFPVRVLRALGAEVLVVSNACGGMHPLWAAGDVMLIADHLNVLGDNPLVGPHDPAGGDRFPDLSAAYDVELRALARRVAAARGLVLREGVYAAVLGPNLETRAEYRMLRLMGGDVVGMSTVPEVVAARQLGLRVLGLSLITDQCLPDALEPASLEQILAVARRAEPALTDIVAGAVAALPALLERPAAEPHPSPSRRPAAESP